MKSEQYTKTLNSLALLIAIGLIIVGIIVFFFWPVDCTGAIIVCGDELERAFLGLIMTAPGIVLLLLLAMSNSRHRILAIIGILGIFLSEISISWFVVSLDIFPFEPILGAIEILGFMSAGSVALIKQGTISHPPTNNRFWNLNLVGKSIRIITFILLATLPLWTYLVWGAFSKYQIAYENHRLIGDGCIIDGVNQKTTGKNRKEFECKNGIYNGFTKTYNSQGIIIYEGNYLNGKLNGTETVYFDDGEVYRTTTFKNGDKEGTEIYHNENGNISLYITNKQGLSRQVYYQMPEKYFDYNLFDLKKQHDYYCRARSSDTDNYTCLNNVLNGEFKSYDSKGNISLRLNFANGILDGISEKFIDGKLNQHLEFKHGKLDGKVAYYFPAESYYLEYEGQYTDGLQNGIFKMYDYQGNITSEVVFDHGQLVKINK